MTIIRRVVSAARPTVNTSFETLSTELTNTVDTFWVSEQLRTSAQGRIAITSAGSIDCGRRFGGLGVGVHAYGAEFSPEPGCRHMRSNPAVGKISARGLFGRVNITVPVQLSPLARWRRRPAARRGARWSRSARRAGLSSPSTPRALRVHSPPHYADLSG